MGTSVRLDAGARLYRDSMVASYSNIFVGTTVARICPDAHATMAIADFIQGSSSVIGREPFVYGAWDHGHLSCAGADADPPGLDPAYVLPYQSFIWFGLVDGYLQIEVFDGRPTTGSGVGLGGGTNLVVTSAARVPTSPVCCHVACVANWANTVGSIGTFTLYVDGEVVGTGSTAASPGGVGDFFLDYPSLTVGTSKDGYRPQVGSVKLMWLRGFTTIFTAEALVAEAEAPCAVPTSGDKFTYPFDTDSGLLHLPDLSGRALVLETGSPSIDLTVPDCCGAPEEPPIDPPEEPPEEPPPPGEPGYHVESRYIRRLRRAPHVNNDNLRVFYRKFELDLERGQALASGQGSEPVVLLRISRDGGQTWGEESRMAAGALGEYTARVIARRLGHARDTVFEIVVSDPIAWSIVGAWLDLEPGAH